MSGYYIMSLLNQQTDNINCKILSSNYDNLKTASTLFNSMVDAVDNHKATVTNLIALVEESHVVDDSILQALDDSVDILISTIKELSLTQKKQCSGLGGHIIPQLLVIDEIPFTHSDKPELQGFPRLSAEQLSLQIKGVQYGKISCFTIGCLCKCNTKSIGIGSIALCKPFCIYISSNFNEILIKYDIMTGPFAQKLLCFPIIWSGNITLNPSSIVCHVDVIGCETLTSQRAINISPEDFIDRMTRELQNLTLLEDVFISEKEKMCDCAKEFRIESEALVCIDPKKCCAKCC